MMRNFAFALLVFSPGLLSAGTAEPGQGELPPFPWRQAGLTERQAAAHLLDRFTFGPCPGELDRTLEVGLEAWFEIQLAGALPDTAVQDRLQPLDAFGMSDVEIAQTFLGPAAILAAAPAALKEGTGLTLEERRASRQRIFHWAAEEGYRPQRQLISQLYSQKILRAVYSKNQVQEVMTDFWFNHFNVSLTDNQSRGYIFSYERDAIRPHVLGKFRDLLGATARHPAMLTYLDNAQSSAEEGMPTTFAGLPQRRSTGLNENFARELLELHTLGVDGGYAQEDVVEVARAFSGWTVVPLNRRQKMERRLRGGRRGSGEDFYLEGLFLFRADAHDAGEKTVLGRTLPPGRGIEDGEAVLDLVARHPSTARHLATKLAVRFVSDDPPQALIDRLAATFMASGGELSAMVGQLVRAPEFWAPEARRQKVKSPFEVAISAVRALDGEIANARWLAEWISRMGQPLYAYQAPTGFPDRGEAWVNPGSLLNRMNFGLQLAAGGIRGISFDLGKLDRGLEPPSVEDALRTYLPLLLPERPVDSVLRQLEPVVRSPELARRVAEASPAPAQGDSLDSEGEDMALLEPVEDTDEATAERDSSRLAQVVGVILGSPEFQRR